MQQAAAKLNVTLYEVQVTAHLSQVVQHHQEVVRREWCQRVGVVLQRKQVQRAHLLLHPSE
jgi:hypothetical protein